jgi:hypothetical protein
MPQPATDPNPGTDSAPGYSWKCNACPYRTTRTVQAQQHVSDSRGGPFEHIVYERPGGDPHKPARRRIINVREAGAVVQISPRAHRG